VSAAIIVHAAGYAAEIDKMVEIAHARGIKVIEDCSRLILQSKGKTGRNVWRYRCPLIICEWPYIRPYLADDFDTPNARSIRDRSFNLYRNEKYGEQESKDCVKAIVKVEKHFKAG
jgi:hypothetical protein